VAILYYELDFYSASLLKQQSTDRHVVPLWHIILILSQPVVALTPHNCILRRESTNTNCIVFGLTIPVLETTIYHTQGEHTNYYTTEAVHTHTYNISITKHGITWLNEAIFFNYLFWLKRTKWFVIMLLFYLVLKKHWKSDI
jgi:hypothetical protein